MSDIFIEKVNEVFIRVIATDDLIAELNDYFTFMSPGHQWSPRFREHKWNGKVYLFNARTYQLYAGLLRYVLTFATDRKYTIDFAPGIGMMNSFSIEEAKNYINKLDVWARGEPLPTREYQIIGFTKAIRYKRMLMVSPTSSGKSYMAYVISRYLLEHSCKKGLIIVPTVNLVEQLKKDFEEYAHGTWDVNEHVHKIYEGQDKTVDKAITISTWQSIYDIKDRQFFADFDFVIGDEAHGFKANSLKSIMTMLINAEYRTAMTGTLDNWKIHRLIIEGLFGPSSKLTTTRKMIDEKQSADIQIKALILKHPKSTCAIASTWKKKAYQKEIDYLLGLESRNKFIRNLALSLNSNTLLLFQYIEKHGDLIYELIKEGLKETDRQVYYVHGTTEVEEREEVRAIVEKQSNAIIIASYGVFSTGINIINLHNIIFASPSKSKIRVLQSIGRGLRRSDTKTKMTLFDIVDDMRIDDFINYTLKHFSVRFKIYKSEEFKISNYNIEL